MTLLIVLRSPWHGGESSKSNVTSWLNFFSLLQCLHWGHRCATSKRPANLMFIFLSEDAPAPNALHSFKAHVDDGKIHVTANPIHTLQANKSRPPKLLSSGTEAVGRDLVIVGGGSGAFHAVESLREVCLFHDEPFGIR